MTAPPPRSAYLHIPFCAHRCGYCNFTVIAHRDDLAEPLLGAIADEVAQISKPQEVDTLYFGGGTPTHLPARLLDRLCQLARSHFPLAPDYEWTVEANPGDLAPRTVAMLAKQGVNRLSLGAQSFNDRKLQALERDHRSEAIASAVDMARAAGMQVGIDLIFAAPDESLRDWQNDLAQTLQLEPDHVSVYGLTYEKGTLFWNRLRRGELRQLDENLQCDMYLAAIDTLGNAGFEHYEISNFARPGKRSRHNENYWAGGSYFAAGPGAARYVDYVRETNHRSTTAYLQRIASGRSPVAEREALDREQRARERLVLGLRRLEGVERADFSQSTGFRIDELCGAEIRRFVSQGLLQDDGCRIRLSRNGLLVSDGLWPDLL